MKAVPIIRFSNCSPTSFRGVPLIYEWDNDRDPKKTLDAILSMMFEEYGGKTLGTITDFHLPPTSKYPDGVTWVNGILQLCIVCGKTTIPGVGETFCSDACKVFGVHRL